MSTSSAVVQPKFIHQNTHDGHDIVAASLSADGRYLLTTAVDPGKGHARIVKVFSTLIWRDIPESRHRNWISPHQTKATRLWRKNFGELSGWASFTHDMERVVMVTENWIATYRTTDGKQLSNCSRPKPTRSGSCSFSVLPDDSGIVLQKENRDVLAQGTDSIFFVNWMGEVMQHIRTEHWLSHVLVSPSSKWVLAADVRGRASFIWNRASGQFIGTFEPRFFPGSCWPYFDGACEHFIRETADELRMVSWPAREGVSCAWISTLALDASGEILKIEAQPIELGSVQPNERVSDLLLTPDWRLMAVRINGIYLRFDRSSFPSPSHLNRSRTLVSADGHQVVSYNGCEVNIFSTAAACIRDEVYQAMVAAQVLEKAFGVDSIQATVVREVVLEHSSSLMRRACSVQDSDTRAVDEGSSQPSAIPPKMGKPTYESKDKCILL